MASTPTQFNAAIISKVAQYVYDHSDEAINVEALADYAGFSKYHFNRMFFAATGFQLGEFIKRQKLEKAMFLLKTGHSNILEVAMSVGYDSPSSFIRAFKTNFGCTPSDIQNGKSPLNVLVNSSRTLFLKNFHTQLVTDRY
ncbi:helix-turn-helix transcriptional regulator [Pseudoalteromonas sp. MMG024]|uniref:helix-turn-helix transcriptional regulator n=1 Tax=Pseudoalteromonas sp. MMG024 TaxID=2909980 RepID=UPI001F1DFBEE|nr:helix-turn-helix transcriptional regulator [Pseudoalteromonas sp. MMG024]MCF6459281.1 helix-turn-helix transcriptional regulator [Pseudoalteromonas sp. MMG024]